MADKKIRIKTESEIEHGGDLDSIIHIMTMSGATVVSHEAFYEQECAEIAYTIDEPYEEFDKKYKANYNEYFGIE